MVTAIAVPTSTARRLATGLTLRRAGSGMPEFSPVVSSMPRAYSLFSMGVKSILYGRTGYLLNSTRHYILWFDDALIGHRSGNNRLFKEPVKQQAA